MDQDRTLRTFKSQFESGAGYQVCGVVAERQRHFTVYEDQVGSTPIHFAIVLEHKKEEDCARRVEPSKF